MDFRCKQFSLNHSASTMKVGTDSILLATLAPEANPKNILDVGTGCGIISLVMAQRFSSAAITAIDLDFNSVLQASENFNLSKWNERLDALNISFQDFAANKDNCHKYDYIVSNPPFFVNSLNSPYCKRNLARHTSTLSFEEFAFCVSKVCTDDARIICILPPEQNGLLSDCLSVYSLYAIERINIYTRPDKPLERIISVFARSQNPIMVRDFYIRDIDNNYTEQYLRTVENVLFVGMK